MVGSPGHPDPEIRGGGVECLLRKKRSFPWGPLVDLKIRLWVSKVPPPSSATEKRFTPFTGKVDQSRNST